MERPGRSRVQGLTSRTLEQLLRSADGIHAPVAPAASSFFYCRVSMAAAPRLLSVNKTFLKLSKSQPLSSPLFGPPATTLLRPVYEIRQDAGYDCSSVRDSNTKSRQGLPVARPASWIPEPALATCIENPLSSARLIDPPPRATSRSRPSPNLAEGLDSRGWLNSRHARFTTRGSHLADASAPCRVQPRPRGRRCCFRGTDERFRKSGTTAQDAKCGNWACRTLRETSGCPALGVHDGPLQSTMAGHDPPSCRAGQD